MVEWCVIELSITTGRLIRRELVVITVTVCLNHLAVILQTDPLTYMYI